MMVTVTFTLFSSKKKCSLLYEKLREERLVSDDLDTVLSTFPLKNFSHPLSRILYTLNDTFTVNFSSTELFLFVITEQGYDWVNNFSIVVQSA